MRSTNRILLAALFVCTPAANICAQDGQASRPDAHAEDVVQPPAGEARGVNPADNLTTLEVLPKLGVIEGDRAIQRVYGVNVELPLVRFESPFGSANGLSDRNVRGRYQFKAGPGIGIVGVEGVLPIATDDTLGSASSVSDHPTSTRTA